MAFLLIFWSITGSANNQYQQTLINDDIGFRLLYPSNWVEKHRRYQNIQGKVSSNKTGAANCYITVDQVTTTKSIDDNFIASLTKQYGPVISLKESFFPDAYSVDVSFQPLSSPKVRQIMYEFRWKLCRFRIICGAFASHFQGSERDFHHIIDSFSFFEAGHTPESQCYNRHPLENQTEEPRHGRNN